jgi:hypothetical protein
MVRVGWEVGREAVCVRERNPRKDGGSWADIDCRDREAGNEWPRESVCLCVSTRTT